jgi:hypothetical protein
MSHLLSFLKGSVYLRRFHIELSIIEFSSQVTEEGSNNFLRTNKINIFHS